MTSKRCPRCRLTMILDHFAKSKQRKDGHSGWCKQCLKKATRAYRERAK